MAHTKTMHIPTSGLSPECSQLAISGPTHRSTCSYSKTCLQRNSALHSYFQIKQTSVRHSNRSSLRCNWAMGIFTFLFFSSFYFLSFLPLLCSIRLLILSSFDFFPFLPFFILFEYSFTSIRSLFPSFLYFSFFCSPLSPSAQIVPAKTSIWLHSHLWRHWSSSEEFQEKKNLLKTGTRRDFFMTNSGSSFPFMH